VGGGEKNAVLAGEIIKKDRKKKGQGKGSLTGSKKDSVFFNKGKYLVTSKGE